MNDIYQPYIYEGMGDKLDETHERGMERYRCMHLKYTNGDAPNSQENFYVMERISKGKTVYQSNSGGKNLVIRFS